MDRITPDVQDGGIADSRAKMEALLAANPEAGSIAAVWAAWDQPAIGAMQAIEAAGRSNEGIVIVGIDANPQAEMLLVKVVTLKLLSHKTLLVLDLQQQMQLVEQ